ncbi:uncharacterized protein LOC119457613 isoform X2 [Dermacentor silvarum]|uniref:uncharacterized protein LOC119457613 isoform X2 n=1 Tax=Dermacentor silvarum TaxID=543639 RepID=UPI00210084D0|nr:uncharacterized protein LOC119457613 isoform X2 [Dermacentor silvarum]
MEGLVGSNPDGGRVVPPEDARETLRRWSRCEHPRCLKLLRMMDRGQSSGHVTARWLLARMPATRAGDRPTGVSVRIHRVGPNRGRCTPAWLTVASAPACPDAVRRDLQGASLHTTPEPATKFPPTLRECAPSRVVNLTSVVQQLARIDWDDVQGLRGAWAPGRAYSNSKRAMLLFTAELAQRLQGTGVSACAVHPGVVNTRVARGLTRVGEPWFGLLSTLFGVKSAREACQTTVHAAVVANPCNGWYLSECRARWPAAQCPDDERDAGRLWALSELCFSTLPPVGEGVQ